ncbi:hypothetical protein J7E38_13440 [Bacillus sp. ISL-35]|uniref:hypothetical protein n=1 Tax=Bacillus sp. ISL-35 TaxID=2819122 RepID=UPI001BE9E2F9|nr:hypothetical protein [Bacillus sp. ISL-35]MBT2680012.1 hypothetical protein [Bacillus sp. ISL-35]MBT2703012.1 hypothetical protein [Chryseobacterium sp. ISL-80]
MDNKPILIKLNTAIEGGTDKNGNVKIPIFESITEIDGELYGMLVGYKDSEVDEVKEIIN